MPKQYEGFAEAILKTEPENYESGKDSPEPELERNKIEELTSERSLIKRLADLAEKRSGLTIRELQTQLPWTIHYHHDFRQSPMAHKDFAHALLHVFKAAGKLASVVNDAEHGGSEFKSDEVDRYIADLVVCALRMANTCPGRIIDLQREVEDRIENKNQAELKREPQ